MTVPIKTQFNNQGLILKKMVLCTLSIILLGISIAFNTRASLGTDPISVFYNGVSSSAHINLGIATNMINITLALVVFIINKKYINIGTIIYALVLGPSITLGINIYNMLGIPEQFLWRLIISILGCAIAFIGLGAFIAVDIGIDPWSASIIILGKKFNKPFGITMTIVNVVVLIIGYLLGGVVGIITLFSAFVGGPSIQRISEFLDKIFRKVLEF